MSKHLARDLDLLHHDLLGMGGIVESMIHQAVDTLSAPNDEAAQALAVRDDEIDRLDVHIEEGCLKLLALHQPVAIDLRRIATVLKITGELERVADLCVHIAERASGMVSGGPKLLIPEKLRIMAHASADMLHHCIDAYVDLDAAMARRVCAQDSEVDTLNREVIAEIIATMKGNPELIEPGMHLFSASRHIERVGDHATNIAEDVVYLVEGEIIRHRRDFAN